MLSVAYSYLRFMPYLESQYIVAWSMHIYIIADKVNNLRGLRLLTFQP